MSSPPDRALSVVIPTLDEAARLPALLADLEALGDVEVVVADGGSGDGTPERAREAGARVVRAPRGRGRQLRAGAEAAAGEWLLFLHADARLSPAAAAAVASFLADAGPERAAYFRFAVAARGWPWRLLEAGQRLRERMTGLVYGDQGLLVHRTLYRTAGGHPAWPLMEDVAVVDRIRRAGGLERLDVPLPTSPRRYHREGPLVPLRNALLLGLFRLGADPARLARWYGPPGDPDGGTAAPEGRTLIVFAKAPRPGTVKTRLAADLGDDEAARIYRALGRGVVDAVREGPWRTVVAFAPPGAREEMEAWLGAHGLAFRPQTGGDLGARMYGALAAELAAGANRVCVVGTDAPGVDAALVHEAFAALEERDVVLGPARDGGYYLLATTRPHRGLFQDIPWSTPQVLERTRRRAGELGLDVHLLAPLTDVDRLADVPPGLLPA